MRVKSNESLHCTPGLRPGPVHALVWSKLRVDLLLEQAEVLGYQECVHAEELALTLSLLVLTRGGRHRRGRDDRDLGGGGVRYL